MVSYTINAFERSAYGSNQVPRYCVWVIGWESPSPHSNKMENKVKCTTRMSFSQPPWACTSTIRWKKDGIQPWRRRASHTFPRPSIVVSHGVITPISGFARDCIPPGSHTEEWNTRVTANRRLRTISGIIIRVSPRWHWSLNFHFLPTPFEKKIVKRGAAVPIYEKRIG